MGKLNEREREGERGKERERKIVGTDRDRV